MMTGRDFHDDRSWFSWWQVKILFWTVEILMMTVWDFHDDRSWLYYEGLRFFDDDRSRFSWWQVEIVMIKGLNFHDDRSRFLWWLIKILLRTIEICMRQVKILLWTVEIFVRQVKILLWTVEIFMMAGQDFSFFCWYYSKKWRRRVSIRFHPHVFGVNQEN